jgi:hypothetical protein
MDVMETHEEAMRRIFNTSDIAEKIIREYDEKEKTNTKKPNGRAVVKSS